MKSGNANIRKPSFAGSFYPAGKNDMMNLLREFDKNSKAYLTDFYKSFYVTGLHGIIVPHAGWVYSGKTAFMAYHLLKECNCEKIAVLGPSHRQFFHGACVDDHDFWETPLGNCAILKDDYFSVDRELHAKEHALEVQMPFIHYFLPSAHILPIVVGEITDKQAREYAKHLKEKSYFIIISSDLSHYYPLSEARIIDSKTIESIENAKETHLEACGSRPLKIAFAMMHELNLKAHLINYSTSAEAFGDTTSVVGYGSFWF